MMKVSYFTFNPFSENTYVVYDESLECIIVDAGCYTYAERKELEDFITSHSLKPVLLLNTHCHIDHVLGNRFVADQYNLKPVYHRAEEPVLQAVSVYGPSMGIKVDELPVAERFLEGGDIVTFGNSKLEVLFTPGHSPGSISFYSRENGFVLGGDVLFMQSIGRTDLPGGNFETLIDSIKNCLFALPDDTIVYAGHGEPTGIGFEKAHNPFVNAKDIY